jgi:hypothetical protein
MASIPQIREHMQVLGSDGVLVGVVDHVEGQDRIKLTKNNSADGDRHFINMSLVDYVDDRVHLAKPADEVMDEWESEDEYDDEVGLTDIEESAWQEERDWLERTR